MLFRSHVAANDPFLFDELMKCLDNIIAQKKIPEEELIGSRRYAKLKKEASQAQQVEPGIGDPEKVSTKGAPKKGRSKGGPDVTKNGRPKDFTEKKSGPLCNMCSQPGHNKATCKKTRSKMLLSYFLLCWYFGFTNYIFSPIFLCYVQELGVEKHLAMLEE